jgi:hypothetical protein
MPKATQSDNKFLQRIIKKKKDIWEMSFLDLPKPDRRKRRMAKVENYKM